MLQAGGRDALSGQRLFQLPSVVEVSLNKQEFVRTTGWSGLWRSQADGFEVCVEGRLANVLNESVDNIDAARHEAIGKFTDAKRQSTTK